MKTTPFYWICYLLLFLIDYSVWAQSIYRFHNFSIDQGLSQSTALFVLQDNQSTIWVGTQDGLNRFDGRNFEVYTPQNTPGLNSSFIYCGIKDKKGNLWFGTNNGLTKYNVSLDKFETHKLTDQSISIEDIVEDKEGNIWMVTSNLGVWKFEVKTHKFSNKSSIFSTRFGKKIFIGSDGSVLLASDEPKLQLFKEQTGQIIPIQFNSKKKGTPVRVNFMKQIGNAEVYLGTNQGIYLLNLKNYQTQPIFQQMDSEFGLLNVSGMLFGNNDEVYVTTTTEGLITIFPDGKMMKVARDEFQKNSLISNEIYQVQKDFTNNIWLATGRGISSFHPTYQGVLSISKSWDLQHGLPTENVWSITENNTGKFLYIGSTVGVSRFDRSTRKFVHFIKNEQLENSGIDESILFIEWITDDYLLLGTVNGLLQLQINKDKGTFSSLDFLPEDIQKIHNRVYKIQKYADNQYFLATIGGVLFIDLKQKKYQSFVHQPRNKDKTILPGACRVVYKTAQGRFYFATANGGLSELEKDPTGNFFIKPLPISKKLIYLSKNYITSIFQLSEHQFALGTAGKGIFFWDQKKGEIIIKNVADGLPNGFIYSLLKDDFNNLWASTNQGLSQYNLSSKKFTNYKEIHGLLSKEFNLGASYKTKNGQLFFGGINGLNYFDPLTLVNFDAKLEIILNQLLVNQKVVRPNDGTKILSKPLFQTNEIDLNYNQRSFTIRFHASNLSFPELINYKYQLVGSGEKEIEIGTNNEIRFNSLQPGDYRLKIYARYGQGEWISKAKIVYITIKAPFWMTWWFWTFIVFIFFMLVRLLIKARVRQAKIEQVRLEMKIAERTYEIRQQNIQIEMQKGELEQKNAQVESQRKQLEIEKEKSERLLRNVIPDSMADELLENGKASARAFKVVSVIFTDFVGFTTFADQMDPSKLVQYLDVFFRKFDEIVFANNLEKIKTIGDAYMCAGGVPVRNNTNPVDACLAGIQIQHFMDEFNTNALLNDELQWQLRLGINTGEVTAGVIGTQRLAYDVWGSTVNRAQRMEMMGEPGKVTITSSTYKHIEPYFECVYKGVVPSKSKVMIHVYQVERIKPELSINGEGIYPNERFRKIFNLYNYSKINYAKAERHILHLLEEKLDKKLHYHSIEHSRDVVFAVERLALSENVTDEGLFLLKTAASYHDAGFVEQYDKNEPVGARMATEILPHYGYTNDQIQVVHDLIYATMVPHNPKNQLEEIICDADLDYLGRDDFHEISDRLRRELREHGKIHSDREWDKTQVKFFELHKYFTKTAIATRQEKKNQNLREILARIEKDEYKD